MELSNQPVQPFVPPTRDEELLRRTADGDRESFAILIRNHQQRVVQLARRLLASQDQAEDVAQDAFIRVYRGAAGFKPHARFSTWLYRIVVNLCHDQRRRWKLRLSTFDEAEPPAPTEPCKCERDEIKARIHLAMQRLPDRQRTALTLYRFDGMSYREAAEVMGLSESAVESLLVRAYAHLRQELRDLKP